MRPEPSSDPSSLPEDELGGMRADLVSASFGMSAVPEQWETLAREEQERFCLLLAGRIYEMMETSLENVLIALYRLDVDETKAQEAFGLPSRSAIARRLAELVIERQLETIRTRRRRASGQQK